MFYYTKKDQLEVTELYNIFRSYGLITIIALLTGNSQGTALLMREAANIIMNSIKIILVLSPIGAAIIITSFLIVILLYKLIRSF